ncbi:hypothetical protein M409DRAFT_68541 [Zasmidium cellare ATCC 36951]|uniref:F-box domain-containing protein n=1 Tax=Zasmidium cellare ATCC 36951 TaxID=1080233 RepID=A0A6A6CAI2_ZASCE|nr:uncharacterized protein M409DRAFT_68541 [Zasmidium cellare ATCC 36951]KAF2163230.1 hypothetical protein M409DRAFT_68541 [Zasmidium cellare ATCC 36951]
MARTTPHTSSDSAISTPSNRITKSTSDRASTRNTRQRSRLLAEASIKGMVDEALHVTAGASGSGTSSSKGKGKSRVVEEPEQDVLGYDEDWKMVEQPGEHPCPVTDKDINPFRIMELPTEIRLEIYRACLTRPYNILLSKREKPQQIESISDHDEDMLGGPESPSDVSDNDGDLTGTNGPSSAQVLSGPLSSVPRPAVASTGLHGLTARAVHRPLFLSSRNASAGSATSNAVTFPALTHGGSQSSNNGGVYRSRTMRTGRFRTVSQARSTVIASAPEPERNQLADPLLVNILRASKEIYKEARGVFYSENMFTLDLNTAMSTLSCLHQRSRRQIKHVELEIPTYNEILERFQETVRLSLRYCSGLKTLVIHMPFTLPGADGSGTTGNTTVYANGFDILRWLPQECAIELKGNICTEIETVVNKHLHLAKTLDKLAYARRQLISNDTGPSTTAPPISSS